MMTTDSDSPLREDQYPMPPEAREEIRVRLSASAQVLRATAEHCADEIVRAAGVIAASLHQGGKILICGNGGSAADAEHMAAELVGRLNKEVDRPGLAAIALTANAPLLTAYANDVSFAGIFARQVEALGRPGDVLVAISTSGVSENVLRAAEHARRSGLHVISLTGQGGTLPYLSDTAIRVPSDNTQFIQEAHLVIEHVICHLVEQRLYKAVRAVDGLRGRDLDVPEIISPAHEP